MIPTVPYHLGSWLIPQAGCGLLLRHMIKTDQEASRKAQASSSNL